MPIGTTGDDVFLASTGSQSFDGDAGSDTVSYAASSTGVYVDLETGQGSALPKIMPFGDSITYGVISSAKVKNEQSGGYRIPLWNSLQSQNLLIDYVGSLKSGPSSFADRDNQGLRGYTIEQLNGLDEGYLAKYQPDVVLLMIGTNDTVDDSASTMISELQSLIVSIAHNVPNATIFVAGIPPTWDEARNAIAQQYNAMIPGLVDVLNDTYNVVYVDTSELTLSDITPPPGDSGVHPTAAGYDKLAADWYDALIASGVFSNDTLTSIENAVGSNFNDKIVGDAGNNLLSGLAGNDVLLGGAGNDILDGGTGSDTMAGGVGDDTYVTDSSSDVITENLGEGSDTILTSKTSYSLANLPNVENLAYSGSSGVKLSGNAADNRLTGGSAGDTLDGGSGADAMIGSSGSDTYVVDNIGDTIIEEAGGGTDTAKSSVTFTLSANVEKLLLTDIAAIDGTGNALSNTITGNLAANNIYGMSGADILYGMDGNDSLFGGDGSDTLRGGAGADVLVGGVGSDKFDWDSAFDTGLGGARDQVLDFEHGKDKLDLSTIDAKSGTSANDAFTFIGADAFSSSAGQLRAELVHDAAGDYVLVQADTDGNGVADFEIALIGYTGLLQTNDFVL